MLKLVELDDLSPRRVESLLMGPGADKMDRWMLHKQVPLTEVYGTEPVREGYFDDQGDLVAYGYRQLA